LQFTRVEQLSENAVRAAYELVAEALRLNSQVLVVNLGGVKNVGTRVGSWEISIRRIED
jgi:hypothetical protein